MWVQNLRLQGSWVPDQFESLFEPTQNNLAPAPFCENNRGYGYYWLQLALLQSYSHCSLTNAGWTCCQKMNQLQEPCTAQFDQHRKDRLMISFLFWYLPYMVAHHFLTLLSSHQRLILLFKIYCETLFSCNRNLSISLRGDNKLGFSKPRLKLGKWSLVRSQVVTIKFFFSATGKIYH